MGERGPLPTPHARRRNKRARAGDRRIMVARPRMPSVLKGEARAEWRRIVPELERAGLLATVDRGILVRYCVAWADWCELNANLQRSSKLIRGARNNLVRNPIFLMRSEVEQTVSDLGRQLGLSPNARIRVGVIHEPAPEEEENTAITAIEEYRQRLAQ